MRVTLANSRTQHTEACTTVAVSLSGDIISGGDDYTVWRWNSSGEPISKLIELDSCITFLAWIPGAGGKKKGVAADAKDVCIVACADGTLRFVNVASARVERVVEGHSGAITAFAYAPDGSAIVTSGEDGFLKVWSQAGVQRSILQNAGKCIYTVVWGAESTEFAGECVLYTVGSEVVVKPLNPAVKKQLKWKAHNGAVVCADWSRMSNIIVTGGEDGVYKVWDAYGRNLFTSSALEHPCTSISFASDGETFGVGSFRSLRICDKTGWSHCNEKLPSEVGSVMGLQWTPDGTQLVLGCGNGALAIGQLVDRRLNWGSFSVRLSEGKKIHIQDVATDANEELEHRDIVIKMAVGHGYLVVCTTTQCICYDVQRFSNPMQFDLRDAVISLILAEKHFLIADCSQGIQIYTYEGRQVSTIKLTTTLRPELMANNILSLSPDTVAVRDPADAKKILYFDASTGKQYKDAGLTHHLDIMDLTISQFGTQQDRKIAFADRNRELYIQSVHTKRPSVKLSTMSYSVSWNDKTETLVSISDGKLNTWFFPTVVYTDRSLLANTRTIRDDGEEFTRNDRIQDFSGNRISVRRGTDGALLTLAVNPYPGMLFAHIAKHDWDGAVRLCRFLNEDLLWSVITAMAIKHGELNTAEVGYAALNESDKVRYVHWLKEIPSAEGRQAELALLQRRPDEAERILLQAGLVYRAIELNMRLYRWVRALEIAVEQKTHVDTVIGRRNQYLDARNCKESEEKFKQAHGAVGKIDWDTINEKVKQELVKEQQRPGAKPYHK